MDISFKTPVGRFNYRVSAVIIRNGCLLTMSDNNYGYSYLPGGRVKMGEPAEKAIRREMQEELHADLSIIRALWLCQDFFTEEDTGEHFHEICLYYLMDGGGLPSEAFVYTEGARINRFVWTPLAEIRQMKLYPEFIGEKIEHLPEHLEMVIEEKEHRNLSFG